MEGLNTCQLSVCLGDVCEPTFKELSPLVKGETVRVIPLPRNQRHGSKQKQKNQQMCDPTCIKCRQKMGESSAETADISAGAESHSTTHNLERLLQPCNPWVWQPLQRNSKDLSQKRVSHSQQCQLRGTSLNGQPKPLLHYLQLQQGPPSVYNT